MKSPTIWLVGDWQEPDFAEPTTWLQAHANCRTFDSLQSAAQATASGGFADVPATILIAVSRPGRFAAADVEYLHASFPLARLLALTGPWCEGEQRSGRPWPGIVRIPWRNWRQRLPIEVGFHAPSAIALPRTAIETERVESSAATIRTALPLRGSVAIRTHALATYRYLADAAGQLGLSVIPHADHAAAADVVLYDGWENVAPAQDHNASSNGQPARRILTLHFPRPDDHSRAQLAGIHAIVPQPTLLSDLAAALSR